MFQQGNILKNYGMELQNMGIKIQNFGMQIQNMMLNIGNEMLNMGIQISNIGMQIFNMGVQMLNQNQNMGIIEQNPFMGMQMNQNMNMIKQMEQIEINNINNNDNEKPKINFCFIPPSGLRTYIALEDDKILEELFKLYLNKIGLEYDVFESEEVRFYYNGQRININDKTTKLKDFLKNKISNIYGPQLIEVTRN